MSKTPAERYRNRKTRKEEIFNFVGDGKYKSEATGETLTVAKLRREYDYLATARWNGNQKWSHNPVNGFSLKGTK